MTTGHLLVADCTGLLVVFHLSGCGDNSKVERVKAAFEKADRDSNPGCMEREISWLVHVDPKLAFFGHGILTC